MGLDKIEQQASKYCVFCYVEAGRSFKIEGDLLTIEIFLCYSHFERVTGHRNKRITDRSTDEAAMVVSVRELLIPQSSN